MSYLQATRVNQAASGTECNKHFMLIFIANNINRTPIDRYFHKNEYLLYGMNIEGLGTNLLLCYIQDCHTVTLP
jgi:hypothetical protein